MSIVEVQEAERAVRALEAQQAAAIQRSKIPSEGEIAAALVAAMSSATPETLPSEIVIFVGIGMSLLLAPFGHA